MFRDDWFTWYFDNIERGSKSSLNSKFRIELRPTISRTVKSYKEELLLNAQATRDSFTEPLDLMFSGGGDSEVALRCYHQLKIPVNVFIFRYENNYNLFDLTTAISVCDELNIKPKIIDFNLQKFFENDAYDIWKTGYYLNGGKLPHMKMLDYLDNIPVMCGGEPYWSYVNNGWYFELGELHHSQAFYTHTIGRRNVPDWHEFSPELAIAFTNNRYIKNLRREPPLNKEQLHVMKYIIFHSMWPEIKIRSKATGFEGSSTKGINQSKPDFMLKFNEELGLTSNDTYFFYTEEELNQLLFVHK